MIYLILKTVAVGKRKKVVVKISLATEGDGGFTEQHFLIRPTVHLKKEALQKQGIDKASLLQAAPFCDVADELIEAIGAQPVRFLTAFQYRLFVSEFKMIGYNCALNYQTLDGRLKALDIAAVDAEVKELVEELFPDDFLDFKNFSEVFQLYACYEGFGNQKLSVQTVQPINQNRLASIKITEPLLRRPGVYYFKNADGEVIYVGKAKRIRSRLQAHFTNPDAGNALMYNEVAAIDIEYTGSDLIAQLLESHEIKSIGPKFNTQQVKTPQPYEILIKENKRGIKRFVLERKVYVDTKSEVYYNRNSAKARLRELCMAYDLCPKFCSLERIAGSCSAYAKGNCNGVCAGKENSTDYNNRVYLAHDALLSEKNSKIIQVAGRIKGERGFVLITNGIYQGFGFYNLGNTIDNLNDLEAYLTRYPNNYDTARIVATLLKKTPKEQVLDIDGLDDE